MGVAGYRPPIGDDRPDDAFAAVAPAGQGPHAVHAVADR
jgi:hypothetical protein